MWQEKPFLFSLLLNNWRKFSSLYKVAYKLEKWTCSISIYIFSAFLTTITFLIKENAYSIKECFIKCFKGLKKYGADDKNHRDDETVITWEVQANFTNPWSFCRVTDELWTPVHFKGFSLNLLHVNIVLISVLRD